MATTKTTATTITTIPAIIGTILTGMTIGATTVEVEAIGATTGIGAGAETFGTIEVVVEVEVDDAIAGLVDVGGTEAQAASSFSHRRTTTEGCTNVAEGSRLCDCRKGKRWLLVKRKLAFKDAYAKPRVQMTVFRCKR